MTLFRRFSRRYWRGLEKFAEKTVDYSFLHVQYGSIDRRAYVSVAKAEEPAFAGVVKGLRSPDDWRRIAAKAEDDCRSMIDDVILGASGASVIQGLDTISDRVCQVIDVAEFCRHVHCEEEWRRAAHETCMSLGAFVHELNTHYGLYSALDSSLESPDAATYSSEYVEVGKMLRRDFQRFGVHLQGEQRDRMACLVSEIQEIGHCYMKNAIDLNKTSEIVLPSHWNVGNGPARLDPEMRGLFRSNSEGLIAANGDSRTCSYLLWHCDQEDIRKAAFQTYHTYPEDNKVLVHELLSARHEVATIMGYDSYTAYQLHDFSLSNIPEAAREFLKAMQNAILPKLEQELRILQAAKSSMSSDAGGIEPWDVDWAVMKATDREIWKKMSVLHDTFTVEGFINGMSALLERLMGVRLSMEDVNDGESWAPNVLKISILDSKSRELFGTVFLDLFQRPGKFGGAALFTLRCGRKLEEGHYQVRISCLHDSYAFEYFKLIVMCMQLPIVALVSNIQRAEYLSFGDLETLCHEFGHALHSILSRTELQHLSGTRGPQDMVEVPSHVFEKFAMSPMALKVMAEHSNPNGFELDDTVFMAPLEKKQTFASIALQKTIETSLLDYFMHSGELLRNENCSSKRISIFMEEHGIPNYSATKYPPLRFPHIVGYGGNYYSYLFANSIASRVWQEGTEDPGLGNSISGLFNNWPSGSLLRSRMLEPGGALPAKEYVQGILRSPNDIKQVESDSARHRQVGYYPSFDAYLKELKII